MRARACACVSVCVNVCVRVSVHVCVCACVCVCDIERHYSANSRRAPKIATDSSFKFPCCNLADMPSGTDCPYPIRILAFFEMIRPYHVVIRI